MVSKKGLLSNPRRIALWDYTVPIERPQFHCNGLELKITFKPFRKAEVGLAVCLPLFPSNFASFFLSFFLLSYTFLYLKNLVFFFRSLTLRKSALLSFFLSF